MEDQLSGPVSRKERVCDDDSLGPKPPIVQSIRRGGPIMTTPTLAQQKGLAIAPLPFAGLSFLSSSYVIYFLLGKERQRLGRMYHRLVLSMNVANLFLSLLWMWSPFAVPEGTPNYFGASGTIQTCTASGAFAALWSLSSGLFVALAVWRADLFIIHTRPSFI